MYREHHIIRILTSRTLLLGIGVSILLLLTFPMGIADGADPDGDLNGTVEYTVSQNNITAEVYMEDPDQGREIRIGSANMTEDDPCIYKSGDEDDKYYIRTYCDDVEFELVINVNESIQEGRGFITDSNRSDTGFLLRSQQEIKSDSQYHWDSLFETLDVKESDSISVSGDYIVGGSAWKTDNITVGEDTITLYHIDNGRNDVRALEKYNTPTDGITENVKMFVITDEGNDSYGDYHGVYFHSTNSAILREESGTGTTIHEYAHSQQDYRESEDMSWIVEGGATYESTVLAGKIGNGTEEQINARKYVSQPDVRDSVLANSSTWEGNPSYWKGQSIIFLLDTCIEGRTGGDRDSRFLIKYLRSQTDNVTLETFSYAVSRVVSSATETRSGEMGEIKSWLEPYIYTDKTAEKEVLAAESYQQCWWYSETKGSIQEDETVIKQIRKLLEL